MPEDKIDKAQEQTDKCDACEYDCFDTTFCPERNRLVLKVFHCINCPFKCEGPSFSNIVRCDGQKDDGMLKDFGDWRTMFVSCPLKKGGVRVELES